MKKNIYLLLLCCFYLLLTTKIRAQAPQGINYQTVIRDKSGAVLIEKATTLSFEFILGSPTGVVVYTEQHQTNTSKFGVVNLVLGKGINPNGKFSGIPWGNGDIYLKVMVDGAELGTIQLMSVPYAMYALKAAEVDNPQSAVAWLVGTGLPSFSQGKSQDLYLNSTSGEFFQKEQNVWVSKGNLRGPIGLKGDAGASGAKGDKGDIGPIGLTGAKGDKGDPGATGTAGPKGDKGDIGPIGLTGAKGDKGEPGAMGTAGPKGDKGDIGPIGLTGAKGDKGEPGAMGTAGSKGDKGDIGPIGLTGAKGDKGDPGATGVAGPKGDKGDIGPIGLTGAKGDTGATGPAGISILSGDVTGNASSSKVVALQNSPILTTIPTEGQVLRYTGGYWQPSTFGGQTLNLSISGTTLSILGGNSVILPSNATQLQGRAILNANPSNNQVLMWNASLNRWEPRTISTGGSGNGNFDICGNGLATSKKIGIGGSCAPDIAQMEITSLNNGDTRGLRIEARGGSNSNDGVIIFSKSQNNRSRGINIAAQSGEFFSQNQSTGMKILSGYSEDEMNNTDEAELTNAQNIGIYAEAKNEDNDLTRDYAAILKGQVYIKGTKPEEQTSNYREFTIEHGFWTTDRTINKGYGLKILNTGDKKNHWTLYCSNTLNDQSNGGNLYFFNKEKLSVHFDQGGIMFYHGGSSAGSNPWRIGFNDLNARCSNNQGSSNDLLFSIGAQGNRAAKALIKSDGSYCQTSDFRLKENFALLGSILPNVLKLVPQTYNYKSQEANNDPKELSIGFIAQDVEQIFPDLVKKIPDEKLGEILTLNYSGFSVIAIKAIQEQQAIIEAQKTQLTVQEERLKNLEAEMAQMKQILLQSIQSHSAEKPSSAKTDKNN